MSERIRQLLTDSGDNYILPFFWQHGEDEQTLRTYMKVIHEANIGAVCVESRPHPDYCGPKWWQDMDVILDEAKRYGMKVWILDDSHFPTGFANGAMADQPDTLCRQSICCRTITCAGGETVRIEPDWLAHPAPLPPNQMERWSGEKNPRVYDDDRLLAVYAVSDAGERIDLAGQFADGRTDWQTPEGAWKIYILHLSRNMGYHRSYINMMSAPSCKVLIDAVYEPHYAHYKDEFGRTIAGFFSDEPELGNGHMYDRYAMLGKEIDQPWSDELAERLTETIGPDYAKELYLLWENDADTDQTARVRYAYMDAVTELVKKDFSMQLGSWCRERGVKYIGHLIEDNNQHARTGSSLGHYFRGLAGQDMAGIDDIGGQVMPQGEDLNIDGQMFGNRMGEFYHYMLAKLGSSAAAIEPGKNGDSMCEIFGAYGWSEGVRLEKYLVDHFMVRGINHYVPHAFTAKDYPDPDCPPHFYAHGHNPQYRHFGELMKYTNRVCHLINDGFHVAPVALLYHGEGEWTGKSMESHKPGHLLCDAQIDYDILPQEIFAQREAYRVELAEGVLRVNTQEYRAFVIPYQQYITAALAAAVAEMTEKHIPVYFIDGYPEGICDTTEGVEELLAQAKQAKAVALADVVKAVEEAGARELSIVPADNRVRYYHYEQPDGTGILLLVNEGTADYCGDVRFADERACYAYHAWDNIITNAEKCDGGWRIHLMPQESVALVFDPEGAKMQELVSSPRTFEGAESVPFAGEWRRSICRSIEYPAFAKEKTVSLPDALCEEEPKFSGFARYENTFSAEEGASYLLEITDAHEGVEVFVNGVSQGIRVVPVYRYDLTDAVQPGSNTVTIEVATTLERENADKPMFGMTVEPKTQSGITGEVRLLKG